MKKTVALLLIFIISFFVFTPSFAQSEINVVLNGNAVEFPDQKPVILNDRTMVPFRAVAESMGCIVEWYPEMKEIYVSYGVQGKVKILVFAIGQKKIKIIDYFNKDEGIDSSQNEIETDVAPTIVNDRTMIPLRALAESMGATVLWNDASKTVNITINNGEFVVADNKACLDFLNNGYYKAEYIYVTSEEVANNLLAKVLAGADFISVANELSEDANHKYVFKAGEAIPEFENAIKNAKNGQIIEKPIKTDYGYYIAKKLEFDEVSDASTLDEVRLTVLLNKSGLVVK